MRYLKLTVSYNHAGMLIKVVAMKKKVGTDEFCRTCMEWRECDENGRCIICRNIIKKKQPQPHIKSYDDYQQYNYDRETDNEFESDNE